MEFVLGLLFQRKLSSKKPPLLPFNSFFPPCLSPNSVLKCWHCKHIALGLKALWMPTSQTVSRPSCSCSSPTGTYSAQKPHQTFPLCALLSALDLLSRDSRFCPIFIGVFFMFYFIFWCSLYEKHPLKMIMLELSEMLVQHGAAQQREGERGFQIA